MTVPGVPREPFSSRPLPNGWRWVRLGDVCEVNPRRPLLERSDDAVTTFVPMESVDARTGTVFDPRARPYGEVKKGYTYFVDGDLLFAKITPCMQNGKHAVARELIDGLGFGTTEFHVLRAGTDITPEWIWCFVRQPAVLAEAAGHLTGTVGQQRLTPDYLADLELPLPQMATQRRIARILREQMAAVEKARTAAARRLQAIRDLRSAYYRETFGELPTFAASPLTPTKPTRSGWRWCRLTDVARLATGHTPSRYHPEYWDGEIPWLQLADIRKIDGLEVFDTSEHTNRLGIAHSAAVLLPKGTVCMSRTASVGFVTIMGRQMATSQDFVNWVCGPELDPPFLMHLLIACRDPIRAFGSGAVHKTIYFPTVQAFGVCAPPLSEQRRLAGALHQNLKIVDKARAAAEAELNTINALPAALLRRAFSGEI